MGDIPVRRELFHGMAPWCAPGIDDLRRKELACTGGAEGEGDLPLIAVAENCNLPCTTRSVRIEGAWHEGNAYLVHVHDEFVGDVIRLLQLAEL
jgi:hypothetical protein